MSVIETEEQTQLRAAVAALAERYNYVDYVLPKARRHEPLTELWDEASKLGFLGVNLPEEYGGGGAGIYELALVQEELAAKGCGLLLVVVSPAICGTIIARFGTEEQKQEWLPGIADGTKIMAFAITEPDAGSNSHQITTTAQAVPEGGWRLNGRKVFISGVDNADAVIYEGLNPWGPWSEPISLFTQEELPGLYAPFMHAPYVADDGRTIYFTLSLWGPYNVFWYRAELVEAD